MASNNAVASEVNASAVKLNDHLAAALTGDDAATGATTIITLAGENNGATMEAAGDVEDLVVVGNPDAEENEDDKEDDEEESVVSAYTNSNYQAVNKSVLVAGSCTVNDPGVDVVVVEHVDEIRDYDDVVDGHDNK